MSTKGNRSSGTQITPKGINQGNVLVDPNTGLPITVVIDGDGKRRLAVDAAITANIGNLDLNLDAATSSIRIEDPNTSAHIRVEPDGSINVNIVADAASGDNMMAVGTEDGTVSGTKHVLKIGSDGKAEVKDTDANTTLGNIKSDTAAIASSVDQVESKLDSILTEIGQKTEPSDAQNIRPLTSATDSVDVPGVATEAKQDTANSSLANIEASAAAIEASVDQVEANQATANGHLASIDSKLDGPIPVTGSVTVGDLNANKDDVAIAGTEDGTASGTPRHFVNNRRLQILASHDRVQHITYADFGTKDQRVTAITYTSPTFPGISAVKTITYTLVGNRYRRDDIIWSIV